jgi:hypothetical protein
MGASKVLKVRTGSIDPVMPAHEQYKPFPPTDRPEPEPITAGEIKRRRALVEQILRRRAELREKYGPLDIPADELKHLARSEERY